MQFRARAQQDYFADKNNLILKFTWKGKRIRRVKSTLEKKQKVGGITLLPTL